MPPPAEPRTGEEIVEAEFLRVLEELQAEAPADGSQGLTVVPSDAGPPQSYITEEVEIRIRNLLGIKRERWDRIMPKVNQLLPKYALHKITARLSLNMGFEGIGQLAQAIEIGRRIMDDREDKTIEADTRIYAGKMVATAVEAMGKMFPELMRLADAGGDRTAEDERLAGPPKPKNLPPQVNVQLNIGGPASSPAGPPTYPVGAVVKSGYGIGPRPGTK